MATLRRTYRIRAPLERVWQALVDPEVIREWSGASAVMDDQVGKEFSLWAGDITGKNVKVEMMRELVQEWQYHGWTTPSIVTLRLTKDDDETTVELLHENLPEKSAKSIAQGWQSEYLGPIKKLLEAR